MMTRVELAELPRLPHYSQNQAIDLISIAQALLVAEHLSFRRAANVLGVRQSAVSRRIRALEDSLGVSIFERHHGGVRLTAAGVRFLDNARSALAHLDAATKFAQMAGRGENGNLCIGISSSIAAGFLRELIQTFLDQHSQVALEINDLAADQYVAALRNGHLDVAFTARTPVASGCETDDLWTECLFAALPREHPLAAIKALDWEILGSERFILCNSNLDRAIEEHLARSVFRHGQQPIIRRFDVGYETVLDLVTLGLGLSLATESRTARSHPGITFCPIVDTDAVVQFSAVWALNNDNPACRRFLSLARIKSKERNDKAR